MAKAAEKEAPAPITKESILAVGKLHKTFRVRAYFPGPQDEENGRIMGGTPKHKDLVKAWLQTKGHSKEEKKTLEDMGISDEEADDAEKKSWCGFKKTAEGLFIEGRQVKACLKTQAVNLDYGTSRKGYRQVIDHGFVISPDRVYLMRETDGKLVHIPEPDGTEERVQHITDARGKRSCISKYDFVDDCFIDFTVEVLCRKKKGAKEEMILDKKQIKDMLLLAERDGLGACRSQGFGRFRVVEFEEA